MSPIKVECTVVDGFPAFSEDASRKLARFYEANANRTLEVIVRRKVKIRTTNQNSYYWGVVLSMLAEHTGHTAEEMHEIFKGMFLPRKFVRVARRDVEIRRSTTELSTEEFEDYQERIRAFAAQELGFRIPLPHEA